MGLLGSDLELGSGVLKLEHVCRRHDERKVIFEPKIIV
jgi:hypothetical protein